MVLLMVIAHRCVQHDSENDMCEYEYYLLLMLCVRPKSAEQKEKKNVTQILLLYSTERVCVVII